MSPKAFEEKGKVGDKEEMERSWEA